MSFLLDTCVLSELVKPLQVDLFSDRDVSYQELYRVLDIIRTAGIADVSLQAGDSR